MTSRGGAWFLRGATALTLAFVYLPLFVICLYAFNERRSLVWPIPGLTTKWFGRAIDNPGVRDALLLSVKAALGATAIALLLGSFAAAFATVPVAVMVVYHLLVRRAGAFDNL